ncbi:ATP-binding cassette domain-containing protein [Nesterenkonia massiliensis]|uniref:ATP-binding cassette domain-containing protein n=1 Tax=Nesterenkonia massiliensis TaxID=1232429 RepID=UPI0038990B44
MITESSHPELLRMTGIIKHFPGAKALDGVDLDIRAGEVHCLLGQNGAGKSTLIKVLAGAHQPDAGQISWRGETVRIGSTQAALKLQLAVE